MFPLTRHRRGFRRRLASATLLLLAAAACTERPTEPLGARAVRAGLEDKEGNPLLVVGSSVRGIARLEVVLESDALGEPAQFEFKNEQFTSDEAWGGIPVPRGAKALVTLRGYDVEGRERFVGQVPVVAEGDFVRQVRGPVELLDTKGGEENAGEWPSGPAVYAGSHRVAFASRGLDEKSGALLVAAWVHDAGGERLPFSPDDVKVWFLGEVGTLEIVHDDRELREIVLGARLQPLEEGIPNPPPVVPFVLCRIEEDWCGTHVITPNLPPPPPPVRYLKVVAKDSHTCALRTSGLAMCWGTNGTGALAGGPVNNQLAPFAFKDIDTHAGHGCGVSTAGDVLCWGRNEWRQLGRTLPGSARVDERPAPISTTLIFTGATFQSVTVGATHTCGLTIAGAVWCWGANQHGQMGNGTAGFLDYKEPTLVVHGEAFSQIDAGDEHTCGVTVSQAVVCWGSDVAFQTGDAPNRAACWQGSGLPVAACRKVPARVGTDRFLRVSADGATTCAVRVDWKTFCWGRPLPGTPGAPSGTPTHFGPSQHSDVVVGRGHSCLVEPLSTTTPLGRPTCWGENDHAQLGSGYASTPDIGTPALGMRTVGIGQGFSCGISSDQARLWCWGRSGTHLGFANTGDVAHPTAVTVF